MASMADMEKRGSGRRWKGWPIGESEGECNLHISSLRCRCDPHRGLGVGVSRRCWGKGTGPLDMLRATTSRTATGVVEDGGSDRSGPGGEGELCVYARHVNRQLFDKKLFRPSTTVHQFD